MKNVIVFGGSGLIGQEIVKTLERAEDHHGYNYNVFNADLNNDTVINPQDDLNFIPCNILNTFSVFRTFEQVLESGDIYAIVDATYPRPPRYMKYTWQDQPLDDYTSFWTMHLTRAIMLCQFAVRYNVLNIILLSSIYGKDVPEDWIYKDTNITKSPLEYSVAKAGLDMIVKYIKNDVHINAIAPGGVESTKMDQKFKNNYIMKYGKFTNVNNIASMVEYLLSKDGQGINGQVLCL